MERKYPNLCRPIRIGNVWYRNRMFSTPMGGTDIENDGCIGPKSTAFYEYRAKGGAAAVTVSELMVHPATDGSHAYHLDESILNSLAKATYTADAIRRHGAIPSIELSHSGMFAGTYAEKRPVLINVHGGGWSLPHTERDIYFCRRMAVRTGCLVFDVDYVLAPEYPYPAALEELEALFDKLPELCEEYGGDVNRVILCGQSAGGNLLGGVMWRRKTSLKPLAQILCYLPADNYNDHFHGEDLDERGMSTEYYGFFYNRNFEDRANHDVSLALSDAEELRGLPPTDILTGGLDNLKPEAERYLALLQAAGVPVTYRCFEKSRHGFLVNLYDKWQDGEEYVAGRIREHLSRT